MGRLNDHFRESSYTIHRSAMRRERLPMCCRDNLKKQGIGIRWLDVDGSEIILPLMKCEICGRQYALNGEKYMAIDNLLRFDVLKYDQ